MKKDKKHKSLEHGIYDVVVKKNTPTTLRLFLILCFLFANTSRLLPLALMRVFERFTNRWKCFVLFVTQLYLLQPCCTHIYSRTPRLLSAKVQPMPKACMTVALAFMCNPICFSSNLSNAPGYSLQFCIHIFRS